MWAQDTVDGVRHSFFNPLNVELNRICHLLALLGARHILHVSRMWVKYGRHFLSKGWYISLDAHGVTLHELLFL